MTILPLKSTHNHSLCIKSGIEKAEEICFERNIKFTKLRRKVLELILEGHKPVGAYDILARLKQEEHMGQPITVYRVLDFLLEHKIIHKLESKNAFLACSHPMAQHNCYFLICTICHNIQEGCENNLIEELYVLADKHHFSVKKVVLEIHGICNNCS